MRVLPSLLIIATVLAPVQALDADGPSVQAGALLVPGEDDPLAGRTDASLAAAVVLDRGHDAEGRLLWEAGLVGDDVAFFRSYDHDVASSEDAQKKDCGPAHEAKGVCDADDDGCMDKQADKDHCAPEGAGGSENGTGGSNGTGDGPGGTPTAGDQPIGAGGAGAWPATDCASDAYVPKPWTWAMPYAPYTSFEPGVFDAAGRTWNHSANATVFGGVTDGAPVKAGHYDGVSQIDQAVLPQPGVLAITTTWYRVSTGEALEADTTFNLALPWSTTDPPLPGHYDLQNTATHEMGHVFGLGHPDAIDANRCLTMYPEASAGDTYQRTLGDGDLLGLATLYP